MKSPSPRRNTNPEQEFFTLLLGEFIFFYINFMSKKFFPRLSLLFVVLSSLILLTGCTPFDRTKQTLTPNGNNIIPTESISQSITLEITGQDGEKSSREVPLTQGENVYELLNKAIVTSEDLVIEFESFDLDGKQSFFVSSINNYNPSADNKFWAFKINRELSQVGISDAIPNANDVISFELDTIQ